MNIIWFYVTAALLERPQADITKPTCAHGSEQTLLA